MTVWLAFKTYIKQCIVDKNKELDAIDRQEWLAKVMAETDQDLVEMKNKMDEESLANVIKKEEEEARG